MNCSALNLRNSIRATRSIGVFWKRFQRMASLPERDQRAVIRLIDSLVASSGNGQSRGSAHP
jgi:hypothetical protein